METIVKYNVSKIKNNIKVAVGEQKFYKNQRKTENLVGERKMSPSDATWKHHTNREGLRLMYAVYGLARGKSFSQVENKYPEDSHPLKHYQTGIDKMLKGYEMLVEVEVQE